jgi:hypothetical protein
MWLTEEVKKSLARAYRFNSLKLGLHDLAIPNEPPNKVGVSSIWMAKIFTWFESPVIISVTHFESSKAIALPPRAVILVEKDGMENQFVGKNPFEFVTLPMDTDLVLKALSNMNMIPAYSQRKPDKHQQFSVETYFQFGYSQFYYRAKGEMSDPKVIALWQGLLDLVSLVSTLRNDKEIKKQLVESEWSTW